MDELRDVLQHDSHHAYLLEGDRESILPALRVLCEEVWHVELSRNPDCLSLQCGNFAIADAKALTGFASGKALAGGKKIIIASFSSITTEAQNALLKTLEEPTKETHFFIIMPHADILLPTVLSRLYRVRSASEDSGERSELAKTFISSSKQKRLDLIADITKAKDKEKALELVNGVEKLLYESKKTREGERAVYEELEKVRGYLQDRSPSVKVLLEHLSLTLPSYR